MDRFTSRKEDNVTEEDVNKILDEAEKIADIFVAVYI